MDLEFEDLTPEQKEKVQNCNSAEELLEFAKAEGVQLTDDQLEAVAGGAWDIVHNYSS